MAKGNLSVIVLPRAILVLEPALQRFRLVFSGFLRAHETKETPVLHVTRTLWKLSYRAKIKEDAAVNAINGNVFSLSRALQQFP